MLAAVAIEELAQILKEDYQIGLSKKELFDLANNLADYFRLLAEIELRQKK